MSPARELFRDDSAACWATDEALSDLRFVAANALLQAKGLLGWVYGTHAGRTLNGLRVSRTVDGRYVAEFSIERGAPTGPGGVEIDGSDQDLIRQLVIDELRARGELP